MADIRFNAKEWERMKIKFQRKYNHITNDQLQYTEGQEQELIDRLAGLVNRKPEYIIFTLKKALINLDNNRL